MGVLVMLSTWALSGLSAAQQARSRAMLLQRPGIVHLSQRRYLELSGGEQQRVLCVRHAGEGVDAG